MKINENADVVVVGGGVGGAAAALAARRAGCSVVLLEKATILGGLATAGLINFFVPLCNGRGRQVAKGMAEEFLRLAVRYGFDTLPQEWRNGEPEAPTDKLYTTSFSAQIFALALLERLVSEGVRIRFDALAADVVTSHGRIEALVVDSKSGREVFKGCVFIDGTGDADIFTFAGAPVETGMNYFSYFGREVTLASCARAVKSGNIADIYGCCSGGAASLSGEGQPDRIRLFRGGDAKEISEYLIMNQRTLFGKLTEQTRSEREIVTLPTIPQMRTTRHIVGATVLTKEDEFRRQEDSIGVVPDFCDPRILYEIPYRALICPGFPNALAVGRCASATGHAWDVLRVIPPAIITGQAAGVAAALAVEKRQDVGKIDVGILQEHLQRDGAALRITPELIGEAASPLEKDAAAFGGRLSAE